MMVTDRYRTVVDGVPVELTFAFFDDPDMTASEYGWLMHINGESRMGVFATKAEALSLAAELIADDQSHVTPTQHAA